MGIGLTDVNLGLAPNDGLGDTARTAFGKGNDNNAIIEANLPLMKFNATTDPGVGDDDADGYGVGSRWVNTTLGKIWECTDASTGAAVWVDSSAGGAGGLAASVHTSDYTILTSENVGVDSSGGAFPVELKASPVPGDVAVLQDVAGAVNANNVLIDRNGSTINGVAADENMNVDYGIYWFICDVADNWVFTPIVPGGLNQDQVDDRVNALTLGIQTKIIDIVDGKFVLATAATMQTVNGVARAIQLAVSGGTFAQAHFATSFPKKWDVGTMRWRMKWAPSNTNTGLQQVYLIGHFVAEGEAVALGGTANMLVEDTPLGVIDNMQVSPWSSWQSVDGAGENKLFIGRFQRQGPLDAFTGATKILSVEIQYTTNAATDD